MASNPETRMTLRDAVAEVLGMLTGLDLEYVPESDRFQSITRQMNRALRSNALEHEWSYYSSYLNLGPAGTNVMELELPASYRARGIGDDSVRLVDPDDERTWRWAYVLPRDALHKYRSRAGLWCAFTRTTLMFSRPLSIGEGRLDVQVPVMREPIMFRLPATPETPDDDVPSVPDAILDQEIDFWYPDVIILRAAFYYAQTDPIMQPRVQTIEAQYKDIMYQIIERDDRITDAPDLNAFNVPVQNGLERPLDLSYHLHPHADERR